MFHFPRFAPLALCIQARVLRHDSQWVSPFGHFRLNGWLAPPRNFSQPPTSFIASEHLGIHHTPLVACLPQSLGPAPSRLPTEALPWALPFETKARAPRTLRPTRALLFLFSFTKVLPSPHRHRTAPPGATPQLCGRKGFVSKLKLSFHYPSYALVKELSPTAAGGNPCTSCRVELIGLEPTTSGLQSRRSPS
jgi:hypothetical protein